LEALWESGISGKHDRKQGAGIELVSAENPKLREDLVIHPLGFVDEEYRTHELRFQNGQPLLAVLPAAEKRVNLAVSRAF